MNKQELENEEVRQEEKKTKKKKVRKKKTMFGHIRSIISILLVVGIIGGSYWYYAFQYRAGTFLFRACCKSRRAQGRYAGRTAGGSRRIWLFYRRTRGGAVRIL